jgi:hypothetical protein
VLEITQAHLPEEPNSFIGRERELDELRRLLYSTRALTLCGPPARHLGEAAVARLWAQGLALSSEAAVTLAVDVRPSKAADSGVRALTVAAEPEATLLSRSPANWLPSGCPETHRTRPNLFPAGQADLGADAAERLVGEGSGAIPFPPAPGLYG